jgi:Uma2 family endonuclease
MTSTTFLGGEEPLAAFRGPKLTAADYRRTPEGPPWYELIDGLLLAEPSPTSGHQLVSFRLALALGKWLERGGGGLLLYAPLDVHLSAHDILQPDLLYVAERRRAIVRADGIHGPPDLVVEILSPWDARFIRTKKCAVYARSGVGESWLVDPQAPEIEVFRFDRHRTLPAQRLGPGDTLVSAALPGFELPLGRLFGGPPA